MKLYEQFKEWLAGPAGEAFDYDQHTVVRVWKNADFDYLFCQRNSGSVRRGEDFKYAGIYRKGDGLVYDDQFEIRALRHEDLMRESAQRMARRLEADVRRAVEAAVGNDRSNLRVKELTSQRHLKELEEFVKYSAASEARDLFLRGKDGAPAYACFYTPERWTEDFLLEYILDPAGCAARETAAYLEDSQEIILLLLLQSEAVAKEYAALAGNPRDSAHLVKRIMDAVGPTEAKTVRVTIRKDGGEFTFKTDAGEFRCDCISHYWTHRIAAADRREFERRFGRGSDYTPGDILRIEHGRDVLYEASVQPT